MIGLRRKNIVIFVVLVICLIALGIFFLPSNNSYSITQYGDNNGSQIMFYTITDEENKLYVIDGGFDQNAEYVSSVIESLGNKVDGWILTHPHPDHIGAFNTIYENNKNIEIGKIYTIKMDTEAYKKSAQPWDDYPTYQKFEELTRNDNRVEFLQQGDKLKLGGLKMNVFSAYNDQTPILTTDLPNDGSLMFKLSGKKESMLFCSDIGKRMTDTIIKNYRDDLKSDYLQMGHHGNGGLNDEFYELVAPKAAFFDAPEWLMKNIKPDNGEKGPWDTPENIALMENMGATIYSYNSTPNTVKIH